MQYPHFPSILYSYCVRVSVCHDCDVIEAADRAMSHPVNEDL